MSSAAPAFSGDAATLPPQFFFVQSPYLVKEIEGALRSASRLQALVARGVLPPQSQSPLNRLRRGDTQCSFLANEQQRPVVARDNDRAFNPACKNSFATAAAGGNAEAASASAVAPAASRAAQPVLNTPTRPLVLYWTDGAKRTIPFLLLKSVALRRGASRLGLPAPADGVPCPPSIRPDPLTLVLGGSNALDAKLLDDKCMMQRLLVHKAYVPATASFDITHQG